MLTEVEGSVSSVRQFIQSNNLNCHFTLQLIIILTSLRTTDVQRKQEGKEYPSDLCLLFKDKSNKRIHTEQQPMMLVLQTKL